MTINRYRQRSVKEEPFLSQLPVLSLIPACSLPSHDNIPQRTPILTLFLPKAAAHAQHNQKLRSKLTNK
ncbi:hypothetical protein ABTA96_20045, partial [Acinetobacter baumannii]